MERCLAGCVAKAGSTTQIPAAKGTLRIGFVPLLHAAPLIAAHAWGYFEAEGLRVVLDRQIGWGNIRDKLVYGQLDASHALVGMPPVSVLGRDRFSEPLVSVMALGAGGNAITFSRRLTDAGVTSAAGLVRHGGPRPTRLPVLAHVFGCSTHHYFLRDWLAAGGVDPDRDVQLVVLPPPQVALQLEKKYLDGYCVGEPWSTVAKDMGLGSIAAATTDLVPSHPEKILAVTRRWLEKNADVVPALIRALLRACTACEDPKNRPTLIELLAGRQYLDVPAKMLSDSFALDAGRAANPVTPSWAPALTFPSVTHVMWILSSMRRWGHLPDSVDLLATARASVDTTAYRQAAAAVGVDCPPDDFPPMRLRSGWFDPARSPRTPMVNAVLG